MTTVPTNLFTAAQQGTQSKALVEFRAGKMSWNETTKKVTADKRKGLVQLLQGNDGFLHFTWKDRTTGAVEDDVIVYSEVVLKTVEQCTTGRVFLLEFQDGSNRRLFYWLQEPKADKDEEYKTKINQYIANSLNADFGENDAAMVEPAQVPTTPAKSTTAPAKATVAPPTQSTPQSQPQQPTLPPAPVKVPQTQSSSAPQPSSSAQSRPTLDLNMLNNILKNIGVPAAPKKSSIQLESLIASNTDEIRNFFMENPDVQEKLLPYLPQERRNLKELISVLTSPQFQQSLEVFQSGLESGQLGELLREFGFEPSASDGVDGFLEALQKLTKPKDNKDNNMDTN